jgi:hypothetical protein
MWSPRHRKSARPDYTDRTRRSVQGGYRSAFLGIVPFYNEARFAYARWCVATSASGCGAFDAPERNAAQPRVSFCRPPTQAGFSWHVEVLPEYYGGQLHVASGTNLMQQLTVADGRSFRTDSQRNNEILSYGILNLRFRLVDFCCFWKLTGRQTWHLVSDSSGWVSA